METTKEDCKQVSAEENNFDSFDMAIRYTFNRPLLESEHQFIHKIIDDAMDKYAHAQVKNCALTDVSCWVAIGDNLPQSDEPYLVIDRFGYMTVCGFYNGNWYPKIDGLCPNFSSETITHWQKLPKPPCS